MNAPNFNSKVGALLLALFIIHLIVILSIIKYFTIGTAVRHFQDAGRKNDTPRIKVLGREFSGNHDFWENFLANSEEDYSSGSWSKEEEENEQESTKLTSISTIKVVNSKATDEYEISTKPFLPTTRIHITPILLMSNSKTSQETTTSLTTATQEPEVYRPPTIVTALLDIGRASWPYYARTLGIYHSYMHHVLSLKLPLVAFVDKHSYAFVIKTREKLGMSNQTKVWNITIEDLPLHRHINVMRGIIENELTGKRWKETWDNSTQTHPEARSPEYDLVVNSKPYFLQNASVENLFNSSFFVWLDAGYGQAKPKYFPKEYIWEPKFSEDKITLTKITPVFDPISRYTIEKLYRQDWSVVSGGFMAGNRQAVQRFHRYYHSKVIELLFRDQLIDDDQTILVLLINEYPEMFNVKHGDWFDAFKMYS